MKGVTSQRWPRPDRAEVIPGGVIVPGPCGRPHLRGPAFTWWLCGTCLMLSESARVHQARESATARLIEAHRQQLALFYSDETPS